VSRATFVLLWCFVFVIPWEEVVHLPVLGSLPHLVGVVACTVGVLHVLARGSLRPLSWFLALAILFVIWAGASGFWSIDPVATRGRFLTYLQLAALAWLIWEIAWSPDRRRALLEAYVLGGCIAAGGVIRNYLAGTSIDAEAARFSGLNSNPNEIALALVLGLPIAWYLSLSQSDRRIAWRWQLYIPLAITAILLTASRGASMAALVALLLIPWTQGHLRFRTKTVLYVVGVGSLVFASSFVPRASLERLRSTRSNIETGSFGGRGAIWRAGLELVAEHPLAGVGAGAFGAAVRPTLGRRLSSHETFLSILVEDGIVGLMLFVMMLAGAMASLPRLPTLQRRFSIVIVAVLAAGSLSAAWDYHKPLWFVLGLLAAQVAPAGGAQSPAQRFHS